MPQDQQQWTGMLISFGVLAIVLTLRLRRARQVRPLKVERLWIFPAIYGAIVAVAFIAYPPTYMIWIYALGGLAVGLLAGWWRGKLMTIQVDAATHEVTQQGSRLAVMIIVLLVLLRLGARAYMVGSGNHDPAFVLSATDVLLAFGLGFIGAQRLEMGMRARELLAAAKAGAA